MNMLRKIGSALRTAAVYSLGLIGMLFNMLRKYLPGLSTLAGLTQTGAMTGVAAIIGAGFVMFHGVPFMAGVLAFYLPALLLAVSIQVSYDLVQAYYKSTEADLRDSYAAAVKLNPEVASTIKANAARRGYAL